MGGVMRVLVCGSRTFTDDALVNARLDEIHAKAGINLIIEGGARGADTIARRWSARHSVKLSTWQANWNRDGKSAGPIRNRAMFDGARPHVVLAFVDKPLDESRGTAHMVDVARQAGCPVEVYSSLARPPVVAHVEGEWPRKKTT